MKLGVKVGDVMTRNFVHVKPDTTLIKCAKEMIHRRVSSLIVKEKDKLKGLILNNLVLKAIVEKKDISKINTKDIMVQKVATIHPNKDIYEAILLMNRKKVRQIPVTINKDKVIGMITMKDILKIEPTLFDTAAEIIEIKEATAKRRATGIRRYKERKALACGTTWMREGECDECGEFDALYNLDGELLCEDCRDEKLE